MLVRIDPYYNSTKKRLFDLFFSSILLILFTPFLIALSIIILIMTGFPVFFIQKRAGLKRKPFKMLKFRTMRIGAEKEKRKYNVLNQAPLPMFKIHNDPRFTRIGRWLSHSGIDELPQIVNVFLGSMSLIGPRPLPAKEAKKIPKNWDWRFEVKPGLFSYWSLANDRHESLRKWKRLEKKTLEKGSISHDFGLILITAIKQLGKIVTQE